MHLLKKLGQGFLMLFAAIGLFVGLDIVQAGSFEDSFTRTYIMPNLTNIPTASLSSTQLKGRIAYDSTLNVPTVDDGSRWQPVMTRYFSRAASHVEVTQAVAPTLTSCTGGSVDTGSSDTAGRVSGISGSTCIINFNNFFQSVPFASLAKSAPAGGNNALRYEAFTTGIAIYSGLSGTGPDAVSWVTVGRY